MKIKTIILMLLATSLAACGGGETGSDSTTAIRPETFKGAKFAPPQDVMNRTVADEWFDRKGSRRLIAKEACAGTVTYQPEKWPAACKSAIADWKSRIAFTPSECRKGDEREGYDGVLVESVSCTGLIEHPSGSQQRVMVFHKPNGEWKSWIGPVVEGTTESRD